MTDNDKMREEFEHYVATKTLMSLEKYTSGSYKHSSTQQSWETWQAAKSERKDKPAECVNGCPDKQVCDYCQGVAAIMPCGASVTNVYEAYDAGKRAAQSVPVVGEVVGSLFLQNNGFISCVSQKPETGKNAGGRWVQVVEKPAHSVTAVELERLRKDADALSRVEWPKHWVDQHVEPKTLHKPVLVPLEVLIRTEFELTHSERGGDYDTKILGILRDIIAQADAAIAAEGEKK